MKNSDGSSFDELVKKREELEEELENKFVKDATILFTDIVGSTSHYDTHGDLEGKIRAKTHDDLLKPLVEKFNGKYIKSTGDGMLVFYSNSNDAVISAIEMQRVCSVYNKGKHAKKQVHITIGLHSGKVIDEDDDVHGDTVNVAARINAIADGGEIVISQSTYDLVRSSDEVICRSRPAAKLKGKPEPVKNYRVIWDMQEEKVGGIVRGEEDQPVDEEVLVLEIARNESKLKVSIYERVKGKDITVRPYEMIDIDNNLIENLSNKVINLLNRSNKRGKINNEILNQFKATGQELFDRLLSAPAKQKIKNSTSGNMIINMDDSMVRIPWEILYDGENFLSHKFNVGRIVQTQQTVLSQKRRPMGIPLKMLILADPKGNLPAAHKEGFRIRDSLDRQRDNFNVNVKSTRVLLSDVSEKIQYYDAVHYAGHSDHVSETPGKSGWLLADQKFTAEDVSRLRESRVMPSLLFANTCHSGRTEEWSIDENCGNQIFGMANAFLLSGVQHYIGTFWEILDEPSSDFALKFYEEIADGKSIGEAVRNARLALIDKFGEDNIVWASYMLYGDPSFKYVTTETKRAAHQVIDDAKEVEREAVTSGQVRSKEDSMVFPVSGREAKWSTKAVVGATLIAAVAIIALLFSMKQPAEVTIIKQATVTTPSMSEAERTAIKEKDKRINSLVADLAEKFRTGEGAIQKTEYDSWTSRPLVIGIMGISIKGGVEGINEAMLGDLLTNSFVGSKRISLVDRELIDKLLAELKLASSVLADQSMALKIGRLIGARFILTGNLYKLGDDLQASFKIIETETTTMVATGSASSSGSKPLKTILPEVASQISDNLIKKFPLQGKVISVQSDKITINIGQNTGAEKGMSLKVFSEIEIKNNKGKVVAIDRQEVGLLKLVTVSETVAFGKVETTDSKVEEGYQVQEIL